MRLLRVQVPEFRALKDVDISFEPDFTPQVFPLGSLNGGGKSTLLQLIFVLLHCSSLDKKISYLQTLISDLINLSKNQNISFEQESNQKILAKLDLLDEQKNKIELNFLYQLKNRNKNSTTRYFDRFQLYEDDYCVFYIESNNSSDKLPDLLDNISDKVILISPSNQPYLFLSREERRALFTAKKNVQSNVPNLFETRQYDQAVRNAQENLTNFFTFDFVDVLVEVFRRARANDFKERNKDNPFAHTEKLEADINNIFIDGKKITSLIIEQQRHTQDEIQGVFFTLPSGQEIYPEDLSHGELKRLAIFVLIKYHEIQDSIVLIDEIENGFHPDWQYKIVRDLVEWGKNNQYILATHSYELCTAVTPAHVKELEPRLTKEAL